MEMKKKQAELDAKKKEAENMAANLKNQSADPSAANAILEEDRKKREEEARQRALDYEKSRALGKSIK